MDAVSWPDGMVAEVRRYNKVVNERDFQPVHVLRVVLDLAGLLRRRGKAFRATPAARTLLAGPAGRLAARMFRTFYREFNLAYQGGMDETEPPVPLPRIVRDAPGTSVRRSSRAMLVAVHLTSQGAYSIIP